MKFKIFVSCILAALCVTAVSTESFAQKKGARKSTSSSKTGGSKASTSSGKITPITKATVEGRKMIAWQEVQENLYSCLNIKFGANNIDLNAAGSTLEGTYSVTNNKLNINADPVFISLTSPNKGQSFNGTLKNPSQKITSSLKCYMFPEKQGMDRDAVISGLKEGKYIGYIDFIDTSEFEMGMDVKVKYTEDDDNPYAGTFKISGDCMLMSYIGSLKGSLDFGEEKLTYSALGMSDKTKPYSLLMNDMIILPLGTKNVRELGGKVTFKLYLIRK